MKTSNSDDWERGRMIAVFLRLPEIENDLFDTAWGPKNPEQLSKALKGVLESNVTELKETFFF